MELQNVSSAAEPALGLLRLRDELKSRSRCPPACVKPPRSIAQIHLDQLRRPLFRSSNSGAQGDCQCARVPIGRPRRCRCCVRLPFHAIPEIGESFAAKQMSQRRAVGMNGGTRSESRLGPSTPIKGTGSWTLAFGASSGHAAESLHFREVRQKTPRASPASIIRIIAARVGTPRAITRRRFSRVSTRLRDRSES